MRKIPTLFARDWDGDRRYVLPEVTPGCEWVINGEGTATRKYDGTCVMFDGEHWWARREVKEGKAAPAGFVPLGTDPETAKTMGWEPVEQSAYAKVHAAVLARFDPELTAWRPGTYELCGPKVNGNPEGMMADNLVFHGAATVFREALVVAVGGSLIALNGVPRDRFAEAVARAVTPGQVEAERAATATGTEG